MPIYSTRVIARSSIGRFIAECELAAHDTVEKAIDRGAQLSRDFAPVGRDHDPRSIPIVASIKSKMLGSTSGHWYATARHAPFQEFGAGPHIMIGNPGFQFFWESEGKWWVPGLYGTPDVIHHPGNAPQPFMRPAYDIISREIIQIAKGEYPG